MEKGSGECHSWSSSAFAVVCSFCWKAVDMPQLTNLKRELCPCATHPINRSRFGFGRDRRASPLLGPTTRAAPSDSQRNVLFRRKPMATREANVDHEPDRNFLYG